MRESDALGRREEWTAASGKSSVGLAASIKAVATLVRAHNLPINRSDRSSIIVAAVSLVDKLDELIETPERSFVLDDLLAANPKLALLSVLPIQLMPTSAQANDLLGRCPSSWSVAAGLSFHPDGLVRAAAVKQLGRCGRLAALPYALSRTGDDVAEIAEEALDLVERWMPFISSDTLRQYVAIAYSLTRQPEHPFAARAAAFVRLEAGYNQDLLRDCKRNDPLAVFHWLARTRAGIEGYAVASDPSIRLHLALFTYENEQSAELLERLVKDPFPNIRLAAIHLALAANRFDLIDNARLDRNYKVRGVARNCFDQRAKADHASFYREHLPEPAAIGGLGEVGTLSDAPAILPLLDDPASNVRRAACRALGRLGVDEAIPMLTERLSDEFAGVARAARRALILLGAIVQPQELAPLIFDPSKPNGVRINAVFALDLVSHWPAILILARLLGDAEHDSLAESRLQCYLRRSVIHPSPLPANLRQDLLELLDGHPTSIPDELKAKLIEHMEASSY